MTTQPNALRLADLLAEYLGANHPAVRAISAELRRLHAQRDALLAALKNALNVLDATGASDEANAARAAIKQAEENT